MGCLALIHFMHKHGLGFTMYCLLLGIFPQWRPCQQELVSVSRLRFLQNILWFAQTTFTTISHTPCIPVSNTHWKATISWHLWWHTLQYLKDLAGAIPKIVQYGLSTEIGAMPTNDCYSYSYLALPLLQQRTGATSYLSMVSYVQYNTF